MKKILFLFISICVFSACSEEELTPTMMIDDTFDIKDNPNDPVQHECYELFKEYNVSIYFNDTIAKKQVGTDYYGEPIYRYETVDLNWTFDGYERDIKYEFDYMEDPERQAKALKVVRAYLEKCSPAMRPFSILLVNTCKVVSGSETSMPSMPSNFRTLVLTLLDAYATNDETIALRAQSIITEQISSRILANKQLCDRFYAVSAEHGWYNQMWKTLDCPVLNKHTAAYTYGWNLTRLFHGEPYATTATQRDFVEQMVGYGLLTVEQAEATRNQIVKELGNYGFIAAERAVMTPSSPEEDLDIYLRAILYLGAEAFEARYCSSPLVAEKYNILYDYIANTLKVEL